MNMLNTIAYNAVNYDMSNLDKYKSVQTICHLELAKSKVQKHKIFVEKYIKSNKDFDSFKQECDSFYSEKFSNVLLCLSDLNKLIIHNEFLIKEKDAFWYEEFFSKTTYYKKRREAINEFLFYYLE